jgi:hypothetical protein
MFGDLEQQPLWEESTDELRQRIAAAHEAWIAVRLAGIGTEEEQRLWKEYRALSDQLWKRTRRERAPHDPQRRDS